MGGGPWVEGVCRGGSGVGQIRDQKLDQIRYQKLDQIRYQKWYEIRFKNFSKLVSFLVEIWIQNFSKPHFCFGRIRLISIEITKEWYPGGGTKIGFLPQ